MIARDIAELVRQCLEDRRMQSGEGKPKTSIIDHLLQDEIAKFTSVDDEEQDAGARPLSADELAPRPITERSRRPRRTATSSIRAPGPRSG